MKKLGIYVHVPFCIKKCRYCGFTSFAGEEGKIDSYFERLLEELKAFIEAAGANRRIDSVFFGGGTPTLAGPENISKVLGALKNIIEPDAEITVEGNPKTFTYADLVKYRQAGVNRLSIGCQSLDDNILERLGRVHTKAEFLQSFQAARDAGFDNINVDLMFAVPGQDMAIWEKTLEEVIDLSPEHISFYSLQIEEGTPFYDEYKFGKLDGISDEEERKMHHRAIEMLEDAGYVHYEISNAAKPGRECRHNLKYWNMDEYIGIGLGASSFYNGKRVKNTDALDKYLDGDYVEESVLETQKDIAGETVFTGLRKREGFLKSRFEEIVGVSYDDFYRYIYEERSKFIEQGFLVEDEERVYLTEEGIDHSNDIMSEFV